VGHVEVDDHVMRTIRLAADSVETVTAGGGRFVPVFPLFSRVNDDYRNAISQLGGRKQLECPDVSMGFMPDSHWKGGGTAKKGKIHHVIREPSSTERETVRRNSAHGLRARVSATDIQCGDAKHWGITNGRSGRQLSYRIHDARRSHGVVEYA